jgi:NitT/TauT family transport system substrate-binding protein
MSRPTHAAPAPTSRRGFLRRAAVVGAAVALPSWLLSACANQSSGSTIVEQGGVTTIKATHGTGLCNLSFFLVHEKDFSDTVKLEFVVAPTNADTVTLFGAGQVDVSLIPYTQFMTLTDKGAKLKVVAGGGAQGLTLIAQKGIESAADLKGKSMGTFQADTLEVVPYNYLKKAGMSFGDIDARYFGTPQELAEGFLSGALDSVCMTEPHAFQVVEESGATVLTDGVDMYGEGYTDCVLAASDGAIEKYRDQIKELIRSMMLAQQLMETNLDEAVRLTAEPYYKTSPDIVKRASAGQPCIVDQRNQQEFMLARAADLKDMGYIKSAPSADVFDWSMLTEVIDENADLYASLARKSA